MNTYNKYLKYKTKYLRLKQMNQIGGSHELLQPFIDNGNGDKQVKINLALYEILNFEGLNKMNLNVIKMIYDPNVKVSMNGQFEITGIDNQTKNIGEMIKITPNIKVVNHDLQFGSGDWTAVVQTIAGNFTGKYKNFNGNGNKFNSKICSIVKWNDHKIIEERSYSDVGNLQKQMGILECKQGQKGGYQDTMVNNNMALTNKLRDASINQNWDIISSLTDDNIKVVSTSGQSMVGKQPYLQNMKQMFVMAPDVKVISSDIQFGSGDWIASVETMQGTFTKPTKSSTGIIIQPTNKVFKMQSCSLLKWQNGKLIEFWPFWDQLTFAKQLGIENCDAFY